MASKLYRPEAQSWRNHQATYSMVRRPENPEMPARNRLVGVAWGLTVSLASMAASAQALGLFGGGSPSVASPAPFPLVLLAWSPAGFFGVAAVVGLMPFAWCASLILGRPKIPARTIVLMAVAAVLSLAWFVSTQVQDLNTGGAVYTATTAVLSGLLFGVAAVLVYHGRRQPSLARSGSAHLVLFVWLFSYAFPWFGEVP